MDMNKPTRQEQIEDYLENKLHGEALAEFEDMIRKDKTLEADIQLTRELNLALATYNMEQELAQKLAFLGKKYLSSEEDTIIKTEQQPIEVSLKPKPKSQTKPFIQRQWLAIAASLLFVFFGASFLQYWMSQNSSANELYASYYEPYSPAEITRGTSNDLDETYERGLKAYAQKNYQAASKSLEDYSTESTEDMSAKMMLGNCYLNLNPPATKKAIVLFGVLSNPKEGGIHAETAQWYLAMAYIQQENLMQAKQYLKKIAAKKTGKYPKLAQKMLKKMK